MKTRAHTKKLNKAATCQTRSIRYYFNILRRFWYDYPLIKFENPKELARLSKTPYKVALKFSRKTSRLVLPAWLMASEPYWFERCFHRRLQTIQRNRRRRARSIAKKIKQVR